MKSKIDTLLSELRQIRKHAHYEACDRSTLAGQIAAALSTYTGKPEETLPEREKPIVLAKEERVALRK